MMIGDDYVNVDTISQAQQLKDGTKIFYKDGTVETGYKYEFEEIAGRNFITQIIPVAVPTVAIYKDEKGDLYETDIFYLALTANGYLRAIELIETSFEFCDDVDNFVGLQQKSGEVWRKQIEQ